MCAGELVLSSDPTCFGPEGCQLVLVSFQSSDFKWRREQETELEQCEEDYSGLIGGGPHTQIKG